MLEEKLNTIPLRQFGYILAAGTVGIFGVVLPFIKDHALPLWPYFLAMILLVAATLRPKSLNLLYQPWIKIGHVMGFINTRLILGIIFFVMITPMGIIMRCLGKDPMLRNFDPSCKSYRKKSSLSPKEQMEKPF